LIIFFVYAIILINILKGGVIMSDEKKGLWMGKIIPIKEIEFNGNVPRHVVERFKDSNGVVEYIDPDEKNKMPIVAIIDPDFEDLNRDMFSATGILEGVKVLLIVLCSDLQFNGCQEC
jgi:hypothetical protein